MTDLPATAPTRTLLVIDDNLSVRESLRFLFMRRGYTVLLAESGAQGLALAAQNPVDGVIIDVNMPGMNGLAVCRTLRAQATERGRPMSLWMMTGARTAELARTAAEAGALALFAKPFNFEELFRQFDEVLGAPPPPPSEPEGIDES